MNGRFSLNSCQRLSINQYLLTTPLFKNSADSFYENSLNIGEQPVNTDKNERKLK